MTSVNIGTKANIAIVGCGDIGRRIARDLAAQSTLAVMSSAESESKAKELGCETWCVDLDKPLVNADWSSVTQIYYLVPPPKTGAVDTRSQVFVEFLASSGFADGSKLVVISTTGVYGDCDGERVSEQTELRPMTDRAYRRVDLEQCWQTYAKQHKHCLSILRVPGIYSYSRLPKARLLRGDPVVDPKQCGYTNRIHADDLAYVCVEVMRQQTVSDIYNVSDGVPGRLSEYLLAAAQVLEIPTPPIISMQEAESQVSAGMLSYLRESRQIDNAKLMQAFSLTLRYPDFLEGIRYG